MFPICFPHLALPHPLTPYVFQIVTLPYIRETFANVAHYLPSALLRPIVSRIGNQGDKLGEMVSTKIEYVPHVKLPDAVVFAAY